jgi:hypothetical protein
MKVPPQTTGRKCTVPDGRVLRMTVPALEIESGSRMEKISQWAAL